jgi:hypothetical protein
MPQSDTKIRKLAEGRILARAQDDAAFRELLLKDPRRAFKEELGVALPPTVRIGAHRVSTTSTTATRDFRESNKAEPPHLKTELCQVLDGLAIDA